MLSAHDVAAYIVEQHGAMSAMKLQKLVYYSQAWTLVITGRPLFREPIRAWAHGPVVHELFDVHRGKFVVEPEWPKGDSDCLDRMVAKIVDGVLSSYGRLSAERLSKMTHEEAPWDDARDHAPVWARGSSIITTTALKEYYSQFEPPFEVES